MQKVLQKDHPLIDLFNMDGDNKPMKFLTLLVPLLFVIFGCAAFNKTTAPVVVPENVSKEKENRPQIQNQKGAIWELISHYSMTLRLQNVDDGTSLQVIIENGISERPIPAGHWELAGFEESGKSYFSMNTTRKFIFTMKKKSQVYAGSIILGCPKLQPHQYKLLKKMKFFNRYPFSSSDGLCELVIGNDYNGIKKELKLKKLIMGF